MTTVAAEPKLRRPWLAAGLTLLTGWLGQLYNGQPRRALAFFLVGFALALMMTFRPPPTFSLMAVGLTMMLVWHVAVTADAFVQARRRKAILLACYNRVAVYVGLIVGSTLLGLALRPYREAESFSIQNEANLPTLHAGDRVMSYSIAANGLARGDMVVFRLPRDPKTVYVRRIVGMPGERVRVYQGQVVINKVPLHRTAVEDGAESSSVPGRTFVEATPEGKGYLILDQVPNGPFDIVQEQRVPEGHYWVLGDNRDDSLDSRAMFQVGFVPAENITRKVAFIYWSRDHSRIGRTVE